MFDKEAQRRRAIQIEMDRLTQGFSKPVMAPIPQSAPKPAPKPFSKRNYSVEAFTNHLGQVIFPEDDVAVVTTGYSHRVSVKKGKFIGVHNGKVICEVESTKFMYEHPNGEFHFNWVSGAKAIQMPCKRKTILQRNRIYALK